MKIKIKDIIISTFSAEQINKVPTALLDKVIDLEEISDVKSFIEICNKETENFKVAGEHRKSDWEKGWSGDGVYYSKNEEYNNLPYYFKKNTHVRIGGKVYKDLCGFSEFDLLRTLQIIVFKTYIEMFDAKSIIEYGCGTGSNITFLKKHLSGYKFYGTDWVTSACEKLVENKILQDSEVFTVDYFQKDTFITPTEKSIVFTNASLEQTGSRYEDFMNYLFDSETVIGGVHIEPIRDLLSLDSELNVQSFEYEEKRGYLTGFYEFMKNSPKIELVLANDFGIGSKYISNYQVIIWKKL